MKKKIDVGRVDHVLKQLRDLFEYLEDFRPPVSQMLQKELRFDAWGTDGRLTIEITINRINVTFRRKEDDQ